MHNFIHRYCGKHFGPRGVDCPRSLAGRGPRRIGRILVVWRRWRRHGHRL